MSADREHPCRGRERRAKGERAHLSLRTRALIVRRPALALAASIHKLIPSDRIDEVTQVFVVKVAGQEAGHVDLKRCKTKERWLEK